MAIFNKSTKLDDLQKRLREINSELDALNITSVPTSDLEVEEANALKRLARIEALRRVSSALSAEQAELMTQLAKEKEEEKRVKVAKAQADIDKARAVLVDEVWSAYEASEDFKAKCNELDRLSPDFQTRANFAGDCTNKLVSLLVHMRAVKVEDNGHTFQRTVTRVPVS